jgi:hypothetical protein
MAVNVKCMAMIMMMMEAARGKQLRIETPGRYREGGQGAAWTVGPVERVVVIVMVIRHRSFALSVVCLK